MRELIAGLARMPASQRCGGIVFASEAALRQLLQKRMGITCGERSIGRLLVRLKKRGCSWLGHEHVKPGQRLGPSPSTNHGGQHNWILTRDDRRKAERRRREEARQARHRMQKARAREEERAADERAGRGKYKDRPRTVVPLADLALARATVGLPLTPEQYRALAQEPARTGIVLEAPQHVLDQLDALAAFEKTLKPPDE